MQTFLPYPDYRKTASCLDYRRLGKQRVESKQILIANLGGHKRAWRSHPASRMWAGHEHELCNYSIAICEEWIQRGYNDSLLRWFLRLRQRLSATGRPYWMGDSDLHSSHRSALLRKDFGWYKQYGWTDGMLAYIWPPQKK